MIGQSQVDDHSVSLSWSDPGAGAKDRQGKALLSCPGSRALTMKGHTTYLSAGSYYKSSFCECETTEPCKSVASSLQSIRELNVRS